jgi:hypothetical protein
MVFWPPPWRLSFKHFLLPRWPLHFFLIPKLPEGTKVVACTGKPDPHEARYGLASNRTLETALQACARRPGTPNIGANDPTDGRPSVISSASPVRRDYSIVGCLAPSSDLRLATNRACGLSRRLLYSLRCAGPSQSFTPANETKQWIARRLTDTRTLARSTSPFLPKVGVMAEWAAPRLATS